MPKLIVRPTQPLTIRMGQPRAGGIVPVPGFDNQFFVVGTPGEMPTAQSSASVNNRRRFTGRRRTKIASDCCSIKGVWCNYWVNASAIEAATGNPLEMEASHEIIGAPTPVVLQRFGGAGTGVMADGEPLFLGDELPASLWGLDYIPANTIVWTKTRWISASTADLYPITAKVSALIVGEGGVSETTAMASQVMNPGALTVPGGASAQAAIPSPFAILGRARTGQRQPSVVAFGDSLLYDMNYAAITTLDIEGDGENGGGLVRRAAWDVGGGRCLPLVMLSKVGDRANAVTVGFSRRAAIFPYCTHFISNLGTNDGAAGQSPSQVLANMRTIWAAFGASKYIAQMHVIARVISSSDSFQTEAGQTVYAVFANGTGTFRNPYNALLDAEVGSNGLDQVIDLNPQWCGVATDKIKVNGTPFFWSDDGTHWNENSSPAMAVPLAAIMATWTL